MNKQLAPKDRVQLSQTLGPLLQFFVGSNENCYLSAF